MSAILLPQSSAGQPYSALLKIESGQENFSLSNLSLPPGFVASIVPNNAASTGYGILIKGTAPTPAINLPLSFELIDSHGCKNFVTGRIPGGAGAGECVPPKINLSIT